MTECKCNRCVYNNPIPVAVGIVVPSYQYKRFNKGKILFIKRKNEPCAGQYALPGGFVDANEHPSQAVIREVYEETGLVVREPKLLNVYLSPRNQLVFVYYFSPYFVTGIMKPGDDALECVLKDDTEFLNNLAFETHKQAVKDYYAKGGI